MLHSRYSESKEKETADSLLMLSSIIPTNKDSHQRLHQGEISGKTFPHQKALRSHGSGRIKQLNNPHFTIPSEQQQKQKPHVWKEVFDVVSKDLGEEEDETTAHLLLTLSSNIPRPKPTPNSYDCYFCGKAFSSHQALGGHASSHFKPLKPKPHDGHKVFSGVSMDLGERRKSRGLNQKPHEEKNLQLKGVSRDLGGKKKLSCLYCKKIFSSSHALGGHIRSHSDSVETKGKCLICDRYFASKKSLCNHMSKFHHERDTGLGSGTAENKGKKSRKSLSSLYVLI